ncbi:Copia protein, partial [Mucuna pruriens]
MTCGSWSLFQKKNPLLEQSGYLETNWTKMIRLCIIKQEQGYSQQEGIDFIETFALVAILEEICILLLFATHHNMRLHQMNVNRSFLNGIINEEGTLWTQASTLFLMTNKFQREKVDTTLFHKNYNSHFIIVQIYMDDMIFVDEIYIHQTKYVKELFKKFNLEDCKAMSTPLHPTPILSLDKPDIMFSICLFARYQADPRESHLIIVKHIFRYLKSTTNLGLCYKRSDSTSLNVIVMPTLLEIEQKEKAPMEDAISLDQ